MGLEIACVLQASGGDTLAIGFGLHRYVHTQSMLAMYESKTILDKLLEHSTLWGEDGSELYACCAAIEGTLEQFGPVRPHWGKRIFHKQPAPNLP